MLLAKIQNNPQRQKQNLKNTHNHTKIDCAFVLIPTFIANFASFIRPVCVHNHVFCKTHKAQSVKIRTK